MCWKLIAAVYDSSCSPNTRHNLVLLILVVEQTIVCLPGLGTDGNMYCLELASTQLVSNAKSYFPLMRTATCRTFLRVYTPTMCAPVISLWRKNACLENGRVPPTNYIIWTTVEHVLNMSRKFITAEPLLYVSLHGCCTRGFFNSGIRLLRCAWRSPVLSHMTHVGYS
jgi:hypothetical protein